jgi:hypothetical protein
LRRGALRVTVRLVWLDLLLDASRAATSAQPEPLVGQVSLSGRAGCLNEEVGSLAASPPQGGLREFAGLARAASLPTCPSGLYSPACAAYSTPPSSGHSSPPWSRRAARLSSCGSRALMRSAARRPATGCRRWRPRWRSWVSPGRSSWPSGCGGCSRCTGARRRAGRRIRSRLSRPGRAGCM